MNKSLQSDYLGVTFQMSLDAFLEDTSTKLVDNDTYAKAMHHLEEIKKVRAYHKKCEIAKAAIEICPDCIEAYHLYAKYTMDIYKRIAIFRQGMELATLHLGKEYFMRKVVDFFIEDRAKPLLRIKFAYAQSLYEAGNIKKATTQFQEMINLNPSDVFLARHYLSACYVYLEQGEQCKTLLKKYNEDTCLLYTKFFLLLKNECINHAITFIPKLKHYNNYLFQLLTYQQLNTLSNYDNIEQGSLEEASYCYHILQKVTVAMEFLPEFLRDHDI